jgi:hypothetical protein
MEAVTRHSADPAQLAEAVADASRAARMPTAALFDDISLLLTAVTPIADPGCLTSAIKCARVEILMSADGSFQ